MRLGSRLAADCLLVVLALLRARDAAAQDSTTRTRVVMLGTGTPNADPDRDGGRHRE